MYKIVEYDDIYETKVKDLITDIFIEEFEFEQYRDSVRNVNIMKEYHLKGGNYWIALDLEDNVIGTIGAKNHGKNTLEVKNVYVKKEFRGLGVSQHLLDVLEEFAIEKGFYNLFLGTYDKLERAIGFYQKNNFLDDETKEKQEGIRYMVKTLESVYA